MIDHWMLQHGEKMKKGIAWIIILLSMSVMLSMVITKQISGKASVFGVRPYFIMSGSMEPTIKTHQFVLAVPVDPDEIAVGDIVSYDKHFVGNKAIKRTIIHRIIRIDGDEITCKGDNNDAADAPIDRSCVQYKVIKY